MCLFKNMFSGLDWKKILLAHKESFTQHPRLLATASMPPTRGVLCFILGPNAMLQCYEESKVKIIQANLSKIF